MFTNLYIANANQCLWAFPQILDRVQILVRYNTPYKNEFAVVKNVPVTYIGNLHSRGTDPVTYRLFMKTLHVWNNAVRKGT